MLSQNSIGERSSMSGQCQVVAFDCVSATDLQAFDEVSVSVTGGSSFESAVLFEAEIGTQDGVMYCL
jgi:hypothetical protein